MDEHQAPIDRSEIITAVLAHVAMTHRLAESAATNRIEAIRVARAFGATWESVGETLGISRQAAHKRYAFVDP